MLSPALPLFSNCLQSKAKKVSFNQEKNPKFFKVRINSPLANLDPVTRTNPDDDFEDGLPPDVSEELFERPLDVGRPTSGVGGSLLPLQFKGGW